MKGGIKTNLIFCCRRKFGSEESFYHGSDAGKLSEREDRVDVRLQHDPELKTNSI